MRTHVVVVVTGGAVMVVVGGGATAVVVAEATAGSGACGTVVLGTDACVGAGTVT
jgi:hypothetical protein